MISTAQEEKKKKTRPGRAGSDNLIAKAQSNAEQYRKLNWKKHGTRQHKSTLRS